MDFPGGLVVKILSFHCKGHGFNLWLGGWESSICHTVLPKKKKGKKKKYVDSVYPSPFSPKNNMLKNCSTSGLTFYIK